MEIRKSSLQELRWKKLKQSQNYREFLRNYLEEYSLSYSDLGRATGFSRSFPSDVVSGRRRLTLQNYKIFANALKLPSRGRLLFRLLVNHEETDLFPKSNIAWVENKIEELRNTVWLIRREQDLQIHPVLDKNFTHPLSLSVFAACGSPAKGATEEEIKKRTRFSTSEIRSSLQTLEKAGLLRCEGNVYFPEDLHLFLKTSINDQILANLFRNACKKASNRASAVPMSEKEMFFTSTFCIQESRLPELKAALRGALLNFVDESIHAEGDRIAHIVASLHL